MVAFVERLGWRLLLAVLARVPSGWAAPVDDVITDEDRLDWRENQESDEWSTTDTPTS